MERVTVIGGGIAGLTTAYRLRTAGFKVRVLEKNAYPGGRMSTETRQTPYGPFHIDRGAQFIASGYRQMHALCSEIGIKSRIRDVLTTTNGIYKNGVFHPGDYDRPGVFFRSPLVPWSSKLRLPRLLWDVFRSGVDPMNPARTADLDIETMHEYVEKRFGKPVLDYLFAPALGATFDADAENMSAVFLWSVVKFVLTGFRLRCFEDGTGLFTQTLAGLVPVEYATEVNSVQKRGGIFYVQTDKATYESDRVVFAVPGTKVLGLAKDLLNVDEVRFFQVVSYCEGIIVYLLLRSAPKHIPYYGLAFSPPEGIGIYGVAMDHYKPGCVPEGTGLLNGALTQTAAQKFMDEPDEKVVEYFISELARTPVGRLEPFDTAVIRWRPMLPMFYRGYVRRLRDFERRRPTEGLDFAGDYLVGPYTEAALASGLRAAQRILVTQRP